MELTNHTLNNIGLALGILAILIFACCNSNSLEKMTINVNRKEAGTWTMQSPLSQMNLVESVYGDGEICECMSLKRRRIAGLISAVISGLVSGTSFTPVMYVAQVENNGNYFDHVFSYFSGALFTSFVYFIIYCIAKKNKPVIYSNLSLPGVFTGLSSAIGYIFYFLTSTAEPSNLSFCIAAALPSAISILLGLVCFKEVDTKKHRLILCIGYCVSIIGSTLIGFSV